MIRVLLFVMSLWILPSAAIAAEKKMTLDPAASYVLVEVRQLESAMLKGVNAPGSLTIARYDRVKADIRTDLPAKTSPRVFILDKPLVKTKTSRQYLLKVEPDTWVIEGANGTAFSLGSMMFTVGPGEIVDLGVVKPVVDWVEGEGPKSMMGGMMGAMFFGSMKPKETRPVRIEWQARGAGDFPAPAVLAGKPIVAATFTPDATFGNYLGGLVNRFGGRAARPGAAVPTPPAVEPAAAN